jgi:hypothetical protein
MADSKITALTAISTVDPTADPLVIVDVSDTSMAASGTTKKSTINQLLGSGGTATLASATITGDLTVDTSTLKVDSANDRVGILTASPAYPLSVAGRISYSSGIGEGADLTLSSSGATLQHGIGSSWTQQLFYLSGTEAMRLNSTGLGVGVSPAYKLDVAGAVRIGGGVNPSMRLETGTNTGFIDYNNTRLALHAGSLPIDFVAGNTVKMTLDASGNLLVGKTASNSSVIGAELRPSGAIISTLAASTNADFALYTYSTGAAAARFYVGMSGTVFATNTTISAISDARLKENVQDIDVGLGAILALKPRKFDWKEGKGKNIKGDRGFIAQEFEQVFPQLVDEWADPSPEGEAPYKSVRQDLIPVLVKAIQELAAEVNALKNA